MGHYSFSLLSLLYLSMYEKANKHKLVYNACEFDKHTSSYVSSGGSSCAFDLIHSDIWGFCSINFIIGYRFFVIFIDCHIRVI